MNLQAMLKRLRADIGPRRLIEPGERIVLAVSGGPDSMAMLHGLVALNRADALGWTMHVAHLNHGIRGADADADADFVAAQARDLGLACTVEHRDVPAAAASARQSLEEAARQERYAFLERVCLRTDARVVAVAHQADDNAETVLHHILRGTGLRGLAGMAVSRPIRSGSQIRLVRPMMGFRRDELAAYLDEAGIPYRSDLSNESDEQTRNRLRNRVLPMLRDSVNPQVDDALLRLAEQAQWFEAYLEATAARAFETLVVSRTDQELALNVEALLKKTPILQTELIRRAIAALRADPETGGAILDREVGFQHLRAVAALAADPSSGKRISLPSGMTVSRQYRRLVFSLPSDQPREALAAEVAVACPGRTLLPVRGLEITTEIVAYDDTSWPAIQRGKPDSQEWVDHGQVRLPLIVRSRRPGERFWPLGAPGTKKLSDFFIDAKVVPEQRDRAAILCDQLGPIWIIGYRIDERVRLRRSTTQALKISAHPTTADRPNPPGASSANPI